MENHSVLSNLTLMLMASVCRCAHRYFSTVLIRIALWTKITQVNHNQKKEPLIAKCTKFSQPAFFSRALQLGYHSPISLNSSSLSASMTLHPLEGTSKYLSKESKEFRPEVRKENGKEQRSYHRGESLCGNWR